MLEVKKQLKAVWNGEEGLGTVEIIFIIAILVVIVLLFKNKIVEFIENLMGKATKKSDDLFK